MVRQQEQMAELDAKILEAIADAGTVNPNVGHPVGMSWLGQYMGTDAEWRVEIKVKRESRYQDG